MSLTNLLLNMRPFHIGHRIALTLILSLLAVAPSWATDGNISGSGEQSDPYLIKDVADWNAFAAKVNAEGSMMSSSYRGKFIKLCANIGTEDAPVTNKIGKWFMSMNVSDPSLSLNKPFSGTFDGGGNTITVSIDDEDGVGTALFSYIKGATIKNLTVKGAVSGKNHVAGLVGISEGTEASEGKENRIENCMVSTTVNGGTHIGGILGHGAKSDIAIDNCVFNGILNGGSKAKGVFFGWGDDGGTKTVSNCLYIQQDGQSMDNLDLVKMNAGSVAVTDCYKTAEVGTYGTLAYLVPPTDATLFVERTAVDGTKFYVVSNDVIVVTSATTEMTTGIYWVSSDVTVNERIFVDGDVKLYLDEGKTLNATNGVELSDGNKLTIDGKGTLNASGDENFAGIGAVEVGTLVIENGIVNATGGKYGAGIGGSMNGGGGTITINGGTVTSIGGVYFGAGIGGGEGGSGGTITINGGTVTATGGENSSGIGGGEEGSGGTITINGGIVSATGGDDGSGIGGGYNGSGGTITINGGIVSAEGGSYGAGIGGGYRGFAGTISVRGGKVTAIAGKNASGIGSGYGASASGSVTLGWTNEDDFIYASNYGNVSSINFVENKYFYFTDDGKVFGATTENIDGKKILPVTNKSDILKLNVSGIQPYYLYTGNDITIEYDVFDLDGKKLSKEIDYTESFDKYPINDKGTYTLTITAKEKSGYTGSNSIKFTVTDWLPVTSSTTTLVGRYGVPYKVSDDVVVSERIVVSGNVHLVLDEGKTLTAQNGIEVSENNSLTIEGEGALNAKGGGYAAGIGGGDGASGGKITINGGTVSSTGGDFSAGIGGGEYGSGGEITINGGTVTSRGRDAAGIGGGHKGSGGTITINGGMVTSTGGVCAAGIGGGEYGSGGEITINGGTVTSTGGANAAGIGGGNKGSAGTISIRGGMVTAFAGTNASGIGSGKGGTGGTVMLGWTNDDDFIYADNYNNVELISFMIDENTNQEKKFYYVENGINEIASLNDISGKTIYPYDGEKSLKSATISGISPHYYYTGKDINVVYTVVDYNGKTLVKETDYTEKFSQWPIKDCGEYTLTVTAKEGSGYTDSKTVRFTVDDVILVTDKTFEMTSGVYRVASDVTVENRIIVKGNVLLILDKGKLLTAQRGIDVSKNDSLTIEGEGALNAIGGQVGRAGIGGGGNGSVGTIVINGGIVTSTGGSKAAGIGVGLYDIGGEITINGGKITAYAGKNAFGIGAGFGGNVTLGWTNEDDFVYATNYDNAVSLSFAENKQFYYTENGVNKVASIGDIAGKELHPYFGEHNLENASISGVEPSYTYTGKAISPAYQIVDFMGLEISKANYVVSIMKDGVESQAINVGEYTMVFTGKGEYKGTREVKFSIVPKVSKYAAIQVFEDEKGKRAVIDGEYDGTDAVAIDQDIDVESVIFNRVFTPNSGYATIMLPFDVKATSLTGVKSIIEFTGITKVNGENAVGMGYVWCNATLGAEKGKVNPNRNCSNYSGELKAYTPYMIEMETPTLGINGGVTLVKWREFDENNNRVGDAPVGNWVFRGTLQKKVWPKGTGIINEGRLWAFSAAERSGAKIGEFVQFGGNNWANPFRAYLVECKKSGDSWDCSDEDSETQPKASQVSRYRFADALAPTDSAEKSAGAAATDQPLVLKQAAASETASLNSMDIVIVYGDKDSDGDKERPTVIGRMNPATGEIRMLPRAKQTYDLKGRKVGNGKKAKGAYYRR